MTFLNCGSIYAQLHLGQRFEENLFKLAGKFLPAKLFFSQLSRIPAVFSSTVTMPWLAWMEMDSEPGHLLWHAAGAKLPSLDALPAAYRKRAENEYPERMSVARQ